MSDAQAKPVASASSALIPRAHLLKFLIPSLMGVLLFLVPFHVGGSINIGMGLMADALQALLGNALPAIALCVLCLSVLVTLYDTLAEQLPEAILVGDSTAPVYAGNHLVSQPAPRRYFNASTGYGTLGYGLPAALGAQLGRPDLPVVALVGDGGVMFTLSEMATAVEERLPIVIVLWHNAGYEEIRRYMDAHGVARLGVDIQAPNFLTLAEGFGCPGVLVESPAELAQALANREAHGPLLIEIDAAAWQRACALSD